MGRQETMEDLEERIRQLEEMARPNTIMLPALVTTCDPLMQRVPKWRVVDADYVLALEKKIHEIRLMARF